MALHPEIGQNFLIQDETVAEMNGGGTNKAVEDFLPYPISVMEGESPLGFESPKGFIRMSVNSSTVCDKIR